MHMMSTTEVLSTEICYLPTEPQRWESATKRQSFAKVPFASQDDPKVICGVARRIGYTNNPPQDLAIYRLKLYTTRKNSMIILPGWYILEKGVFAPLPETSNA